MSLMLRSHVFKCCNAQLQWAQALQNLWVQVAVPTIGNLGWKGIVIVEVVCSTLTEMHILTGSPCHNYWIIGQKQADQVQTDEHVNATVTTSRKSIKSSQFQHRRQSCRMLSLSNCCVASPNPSVVCWEDKKNWSAHGAATSSPNPGVWANEFP